MVGTSDLLVAPTHSFFLRFIFRQSKIDGFLKILNFLQAIANEN